MSQPLYFTGTEIIGDILNTLPEASEILLSHGVACASCHINMYETLEDGILGHGFEAQTLQDILDDLNEASQDLGLTPQSLEKKPPALTPEAIEKIQYFQTQQEKKDYGLRVEITDPHSSDPSYFLDLENRPEKEDKVICCGGITLFLSPDSYRYLQNKTIDYVVEGEEEGFKIT